MTDAIRLLIVDDEPIARSRLRALCSGLEGVEIIGEAADGEEAIERIVVFAPDVILLDIAMPGLDGLGVARQLNGHERRPAIIFCTALPDHALTAFEIEAVDYLLKPIGRERLTQAIERARRWRSSIPEPTRTWLNHIWVPKLGRMLRIALDDVETIEAEGDYCRFSTASDSYLLHESLTRLEKHLDPKHFTRIRRSLVVQIEAICSVAHIGGGAWNVELRNGRQVRVGDTYLKAFKSVIGRDPTHNLWA